MLKPNPTPHSNPEILTRFQEALARADRMPSRPALWLGFAGARASDDIAGSFVGTN